MDIDSGRQIVAVHLVAHEVVVIVVLSLFNINLIDSRWFGGNYAQVVNGEYKLVSVADGMDANVVLAIRFAGRNVEAASVMAHVVAFDNNSRNDSSGHSLNSWLGANHDLKALGIS